MTDNGAPLRNLYAGQDFSILELAALRWLSGFYQLEHLLSAREWALRLAGPGTGAALPFAALVHDAERFFPGGPSSTPAAGFDDPDYLFAHSTRSADIVCAWLDEQPQRVDPAFRRRVRQLILRHELGGDPEEDILQAADSLAWFSTFDWLVIDWVAEGHYSVDGAREKLDYMLTRIRPPMALRLALPLYTRTVAALEAPPLNFDRAARRRDAGDLHLLTGL